jgi:hypothetical protein
MTIYKDFDSSFDVVPSSETVVTTGMWTGDSGLLTTAKLSSVQLSGSGEYYFDVYDKEPVQGQPGYDALGEVQFSIAYGHVSGGGAPTLTNNVLATRPTEAVYSQYRNLLLGADDVKFKFNGVESDHIYVINIQRARLKQRIDPGNWELPLSGANGLVTFIDDSGDTVQAFTQTTAAGRIFNVVSGSLTEGVKGEDFNGNGFGYVYPDLGIIVLNPEAICPKVGFYSSGSNISTIVGSSVGSSYAGRNIVYNRTTFNSLDNTANIKPFAPLTASLLNAEWSDNPSAYNSAGLYASLRLALNNAFPFQARSAENISSTHYFVRLRNFEYNYSNNPTFVNDDNTLAIAAFRNDPRTYITTVGLYNDNNELLGVAKLSKPVRKSFTEEVLLRVRLDY